MVELKTKLSSFLNDTKISTMYCVIYNTHINKYNDHQIQLFFRNHLIGLMVKDAKGVFQLTNGGYPIQYASKVSLNHFVFVLLSVYKLYHDVLQPFHYQLGTMHLCIYSNKLRNNTVVKLRPFYSIQKCQKAYQ